MTYEEIAIPPVRRAEGIDPLFDSPRASGAGEDGPATSLEAERLGLLGNPGVPIDGARRMERWIASNLDLDDKSDTETAPHNAWSRFIGRLPALKRAPNRRRGERGPREAWEGWSWFRIAYKRGITVIRLVDRSLVKESQIRGLSGELVDLIAAGNHRVVLNFQGVERLASWVVVAVDEARRRCLAADGGGLKICGLQPQLAGVFSIAGVAAGVPLYPDEPTAIDSPWPESTGPRPLPIEILSALTLAADLPPIRGGAPFEASGVPGRVEPPRATPGPSPAPAVTSGAGAWLIVQLGGAKGRPVPINGARFLIGREQNCDLRLGSALVSKLHAAIERRDGRIFLQDLGSTNGTVVNGRPLRNREVEIRDGDRLQIGPLVSTLAIGSCRPPQGGVEDLVAGWVRTEAIVTRSTSGESAATEVYETAEGMEEPVEADAAPESALRVRHAVIQDVLVITPQVPDLENDATIELLRSRLHALFDQPLPRQVVVSLEYVGHLSGHAIGVLLAHHLRLDRAGGALRICEARARIMAVLHQVRLTVLVECHPTLDEAVLSAWPCGARRPAADD